jgi:aminoglycoside 2'-N-acetyltransferase I
LYQQRGWQLWRGHSYALTPQGIIRTPDDDGCIHVFSSSLDRDRDILCDWREGDVW